MSMNYQKIYDNLIEKVMIRGCPVGYYESHHIIPRCCGGSNDPENLVNLTPEEHYVAHQLLAKASPKNPGLLRAAVMMACNRSTNKLYGWLRRRLSVSQSEKMINGGSPTFNKRWISNEFGTMLVDKQLADVKIVEGSYIAGKLAKRAECGHLVKERCIKCENLPRKSYDKKIAAGKKLANDLFYEFKNSTAKSVCEFAKMKNTTQPRLSMLWRKHVAEYNNNKQHGKSFNR